MTHKLLPGMLLLFGVLIGCRSESEWGWEALTGLPDSISFRGLSVVSDEILWASGTKGTIALTQDSGQSWSIFHPYGTDRRDFRSIHAWNAEQALALAVGDTGLILKTTNQGMSWDTVYLDPTPGVFLDDLSLRGAIGYAIGDAIDGQLYLLSTVDSGRTWSRVDPASLPAPVGTEGAFAASGSNVVVREGLTGVVSGAGTYPRFIYLGQNDWKAVRIPLQAGNMAGAYSVDFQSDHLGIAVGGNFIDSARVDSVACITSDGGRNWELIPANTGPRGYRSCVTWHSGWQCWFATGRTGLDWSSDGQIWQSVHSHSGYYVCQASEHALWCIGRNGRFAKLTRTL